MAISGHMYAIRRPMRTSKASLKLWPATTTTQTTSRIVTMDDNAHADGRNLRDDELTRDAIRFSVLFPSGACWATAIEPGFIPEDMSLTVH